MATIKVNFDTDKLRREIKGIRDQVPFATRKTLNALARKVKADIDGQLKSRLDRPTRFTLRSITTENSKSSNMTAVVKVKDKPRATGKSEREVLKHLFTGGSRIGKGTEGALKSLGVLPAGKFVVPGDKAPLDAFGNIRRTFIKNLINYFKSFRPSGKNTSTLAPGVWLRKFDRAQKKARKKRGLSGSFEFFVVHQQIDKAASKRKATGPKPEPVLLFVDRPRYRKYFDMEKTGRKIILRDLDAEFAKQYEQAIRTAKPIG